MTIGEGYIDWQRVQSRAGVPLYRDTALSVLSDTTIGPFYVGTWPNVFLQFIVSNSSYYQVTLTWYKDEAMTVQVYSFAFQITGSAGAYLENIGVVSPWLSITFHPISTTAGVTLNIAVVPNSSNFTLRSMISAPLANTYNFSASATSVVTQGISYTTPGEALFFFYTTATTWDMQIQKLTTAGSWSTLYYWDNTLVSGLVNQRISLPSDAARIYFGNSDASARNVTWVLDQAGR